MYLESTGRSNEWDVSPSEVQASTEVLKDDEMFITSLPNGLIPYQEKGELGLYYRDTRFLNHLEILLEDKEPLFLSAETKDSHFAKIELTNPELTVNNSKIPMHTIHLRELRVVRDSFFQRLRLVNYNPWPVFLKLTFKFGADFVDIFEVRGILREERGEKLPAKLLRNGILFSYRGLDGITMGTEVIFSPRPKLSVRPDGTGVAEFRLKLAPQRKVYLYTRINAVIEGDPKAQRGKGDTGIAPAFLRAANYQLNKYRRWKEECTKFQTDNTFFNYLFERGVTDLGALNTDYPEWGSILVAGIPWYAAPFGRDALITAWQTLIVNPELAKRSLRFLARLQGEDNNAWRDEKPGKIMHEIRRGEMARRGEVPHTPYYGSVDSTLWFIILLSEVYRWLQDEELVRELAEPLRKCLLWCREYGDLDGDGYIEYRRESERGLTNQGWKDSWDAVVRPDGTLAEAPIALVEVQAYYYLALRRCVELFELLGDRKEAMRCQRQARQLKQKFIQDFWMSDREFLAFALDGKKQPVKTIVSNPGHCLFTGILPANLADKVARRLFEADMFSGWGIRTMSKLEQAYNPMSYHNGSIWPHDNSIIAAGLRCSDQHQLLLRLANSLYEAALSFPYYRLPELFCGFTRRGQTGPVHYPTACDPQAWAVGSLFSLLHSLLGIRSERGDVVICKPLLPQGVNEVLVKNLRVGRGKIDLEFTRKNDKVYCNVLQCEGKVRVVFEP
ncbi:hypothetical protein CHY_0669 [Calderihabitans maritimus]|uniref:Amylo-alpha-1,6-glucosidase n=2 Tax=Calderihabitans maritimus TaxID=1246530 RepID=A0A1Z5HRD4_9FIRM|nr:hypothetical protein CHY_0669 [Calderihabitans maritimus]